MLTSEHPRSHLSLILSMLRCMVEVSVSAQDDLRMQLLHILKPSKTIHVQH